MKNHPGAIINLRNFCIAVLLVLITPILSQASGLLYRVDKLDLSLLLTRMAGQVKAGVPLRIDHPMYGSLVINNTLEPELQKMAQDLLTKVRYNRRLKKAAVVAIEPSTGKVLALAGVKNGKLDPWTALRADAPAASLFKVVTAAAAVEENGLVPNSRLGYTGRSHTLYKSQLKKKYRYRPRYTTLKHSFANSINPVFARLGIHHLGRDVLTNYARAMGFGRRLSFELPVGVSRLVMPKTDYELGEVASGFHRYNTISPLHAALMVGVFTNGGYMMEPYVVDRVMDTQGRLHYSGAPSGSGRLVSKGTCGFMQELFSATVKRGTAKKAFRTVRRDRVLKHLELGGKTGTLKGPDRKVLYEWFAGYAHDPKGGRTLAVAAMVAHGKHKLAEPEYIARQVMRRAFETDWGRYSAEGEKASRTARLVGAPDSINKKYFHH
jgi:peptidoglycan glycosyltransferase